MSVPYSLRTAPPPWGGPTALTRAPAIRVRPAGQQHVLSTIAHRSGAGDGRAVQAVGFADMVGFTELSRQMAPHELTRLIRCFERQAVEVVVAHGGRLVKFIGDEAMYVAETVHAAVDIALILGDRLAASEVAVELHCGIAYGPTVSVGSDVFGHTVNLASRLTGVARRNSVVVTRDAARRLEDRPDLRTRRVLHLADLKGVGRTPMVSVSRRAGS
jgi:adenylate cyclase